MTVGLNTSPLDTKTFQAFRESVPVVSDNSQRQNYANQTAQQQKEKKDDTIRFLTGLGIAMVATMVAAAGLASRRKTPEIAVPKANEVFDLVPRKTQTLEPAKRLSKEALDEKAKLAKQIEDLENWLKYVKEHPDKALEKADPKGLKKLEERIAKMKAKFASM